MKKYFIYIALACICFSCKQNTEIQKTNDSNPVKIVVHRGANRLAPENTMAALLKAVELGADYIEIDVATSRDSIMYCFHDKTLERTTNGQGEFAGQNSSYIESLDAGSWFSPSFSGEKIPRVKDILKQVNGKANVYFDVKNADINKLIEVIKTEGYEKKCFVWFSDRELAKEFHSLAPEIELKMNASTPEEADQLIQDYNPKIIECDLYKITPELKQFCKENNIRLMANLLRDSWWEYRKAIDMGIDMVNVDHPDYFQSMLKSKNHAFNNYTLVAHRGGIIEDIFDEFDPHSIQAAIDSGYQMLEIDVRPTKDKKVIVHHDNDLYRIYGVKKTPDELTLDELKKLKAEKGGYSPMTFEEVTKMCRGKVRFMVDIKPRNPEPWFCLEVKRILEKYDMLENAIFIRHDIRKYFEKGKYGFRLNEAQEFKERLEKGEDIAAHYYLFDHGNRINAETARWCQHNYIEVCASVNIDHYRMEDHMMGARRDIKYLKKCGVTMFQIDSDYDDYFRP